jgi:hypothetical protein
MLPILGMIGKLDWKTIPPNNFHIIAKYLINIFIPS